MNIHHVLCDPYLVSFPLYTIPICLFLKIHRIFYLLVIEGCFNVITSTVAYPVENIVTKTSETYLVLTWRLPSRGASLRTGYNLTCVPLLMGIPVRKSLLLTPLTFSVKLNGLFPGVPYNCSIFTITSDGSSPPLSLILYTNESGMESL